MTSPLRTEENQNHGPLDGDRQPHLGRRRGLPDRRSRAGRPNSSDAAIVSTSDEARALLAEANADDVGAVGAYIAPVELKDGGEVKPGNLREHIRVEGPHHRSLLPALA